MDLPPYLGPFVPPCPAGDMSLDSTQVMSLVHCPGKVRLCPEQRVALHGAAILAEQ